MNRRMLVGMSALAVVVIAAVNVGLFALRFNPGRHPRIWAAVHGWKGKWNAPFVAKAAGAEGLRIRQPQWNGEVLFETDDAELAREFLGLVQIDEVVSGYDCACVRGRVIEVLSPSVLRPWSDVSLSFSLQHASALRSGELWPADAQLTPASAEAVCAWLVAHGIDVESPAKQAARIAAAIAAREAAQDAFLGRERAAALRAIPEDGSVAPLLERWAPDLTDRIALAVRISAIESSIDRDAGGGAQGLVRDWLGEVDDFAAIAAAFDRMLAEDPEDCGVAYELDAIARWHDDEFPPGVLPDLRRRAARTLLASTVDSHRYCGVELLGQLDSTPEIRKTLLGLLPAEGGTEPATDSQMKAASLVVAFCEPSMFPRLQDWADTSVKSHRWAQRMERCIAARRDPAGVDLDYDTMHVLPRFPLEGVVRAADGTVVACASVRLTEPRLIPAVGEFLGHTFDVDTDEHGRFRLDVPVGRYWHLSVVHDDHPYLLRRHDDLRDRPARPMELVLPEERTIRGRVVDAEGRPIGGARVFATRESPFTTRGECGVVTARDGTFELRGFDAEAAEIHVSMHLHGREDEDGDYETSNSQDFVIRPGDPPVELRVLDRGNWGSQ